MDGRSYLDCAGWSYYWLHTVCIILYSRFSNRLRDGTNKNVNIGNAVMTSITIIISVYTVL